MEVSGIALCLFAFSVFFAVLYLVIALAVHRRYTAHIEDMQRVLYTIFVKTNLPLGILAVSLNAYDVLRYDEIKTGFLLCCIFFAVSFILERLIDKLAPESELYTAASVPQASNPLFTALELLDKTAEQKSILLSAINDYNGALLTGIKTTQDNIDTTALLITEYIQTEKQMNETFAEKIKICNNIFEKLAGSADSAHKKVKSLNAKLSSSCAALASVENQEHLLKDINVTFTSIFNDRSIELNKKIQRILDSLDDIAYKCAYFQSFPRPYKEMIDLYSVKLESLFKVLDRRKYNLLWKEHVRTGKACVFDEPDRAIVELGEAIRIKSEYADSYYYRGMAHEYKDGPDYRAALQDYEKALKLKPNSGVYANCIERLLEKLKLKTGAEVYGQES